MAASESGGDQMLTIPLTFRGRLRSKQCPMQIDQMGVPERNYTRVITSRPRELGYHLAMTTANSIGYARAMSAPWSKSKRTIAIISASISAFCSGDGGGICTLIY